MTIELINSKSSYSTKLNSPAFITTANIRSESSSPRKLIKSTIAFSPIPSTTSPTVTCFVDCRKRTLCSPSFSWSMLTFSSKSKIILGNSFRFSSVGPDNVSPANVLRVWVKSSVIPCNSGEPDSITTCLVSLVILSKIPLRRKLTSKRSRAVRSSSKLNSIRIKAFCSGRCKLM